MTALQFSRWNVRGQWRRIVERRIEATQSQLQRRHRVVVCIVGAAIAIVIVVSHQARGAQLTRHSRQARVFIVPIRHRGNIVHGVDISHGKLEPANQQHSKFFEPRHESIQSYGTALASRVNGIYQSRVGHFLPVVDAAMVVVATMETAAAAATIPPSPLEAVQALLEERLEALGLDVETYGPYVVSLLPATGDSLALEEEDTTDATNHLDSNAEEWESVWELLQASSESHSEDPSVWTNLQTDIVDTFRKQVRVERQFRRAQYQQNEAQRLAHEQEERNLALQAAELEQECKLAAAATANQIKKDDDEVKKALVSRFAYEEDDDEEENGTAAAAAAAAAAASSLPPILNNRDMAKQVEAEKAQELRAHKTATKKEEQAKTKESKLHKEKLKEARQQRAVKGERRR
jgi:hypothetical protein